MSTDKIEDRKHRLVNDAIEIHNYIDLKNYKLGSEVCDSSGISQSSIWSWNPSGIVAEDCIKVGGKLMFTRNFFEKMYFQSRVTKHLNAWDNATNLSKRLPAKLFAELFGLGTTSNISARARRVPEGFDRIRAKKTFWYKVEDEIIDLLLAGKTVHIVHAGFKNEDYKELIEIKGVLYGAY